MGILALDRRIDAEVLDARGALSVVTGGQELRGTLREIPQLFVAGAQLSIALQVGADRFDAVCRVLDDAVVVTPGSRLQLEVLKASPADVSGIEPFDLVPRTPPQGVPPPVGPATLEDMAPEDDEPTGVVGTLREMPVSEIVQTLNQGAKDALVEVRPKGGPQGSLYVERGRVIHCSTSTGAMGEEAFFQLFHATRGAFRIRYGRHTRDKNISRDTVFLLLEGARLLDEMNSGKQFPPAEPMMAPPVVEPPVLEAFEAGVTLVDQVAPPEPSSSGPFMRFFDEAGVPASHSSGPPPLPRDTMRFQSLKLPDVMEDDDADRVDTDRTLPARKRNSLVSEPPR